MQYGTRVFYINFIQLHMVAKERRHSQEAIYLSGKKVTEFRNFGHL